MSNPRVAFRRRLSRLGLRDLPRRGWRGLPRLDLRGDRNYALAMLNGWFVTAGDGFMNSAVVLSSFMAALGAPNLVIGLLPSIQNGVYMLPQLLVAAKVRHLPRKIVVYRAASTLRSLSFVGMAASSALLAGHPAWLIFTFLAMLVLNSAASGVAGLPFWEVVAKTIPVGRRPTLFGTRQLVGGFIALAEGFAVRAVLASSIPFPLNYTLLLVLGGSMYTVGYWVFGLVDEPPDPPAERGRLRDELFALPGTVRLDPDFAAFLRLRIMLAVATLSDAFFTVFALREIHVPQAMIGVFLITLGVVAPTSNLVWTRLNLRNGSRRIIRIALALGAAAPLAAAFMSQGAAFTYLIVFVLSGIAWNGLGLGLNNHLLAIAPAAMRPRYIGVTNMLVGLASFAPVVGGQLADLLGYRPVFIIGAGLYAVCWFMAGRLRRDAL